MPKKRFLGNRSFILIAVLQSTDLRPMALRSGNQSQLKFSRWVTDAPGWYIENDTDNGTRHRQISSRGIKSCLLGECKRTLRTEVDQRLLRHESRFARQRKESIDVTELPPFKQPLVGTGLKRQVQANVGINALDSVHRKSPLPATKNTI